eukprot:TRINITY_DN123478_c0_g1_i1.p1 TRINITY_DN123478_c0_g1~~TRINITY_DN123478_c0_g1_i1.p1  ORF type:complete len:275 (-),score=52.46 TRINITY_DN123478_c0_g1_i1:139-963(-)
MLCMSGSCSGNIFHHSTNPRFAEWRKRVRIYCGDWELEVVVQRRLQKTCHADSCEGNSWPQFVKKHDPKAAPIQAKGDDEPSAETQTEESDACFNHSDSEAIGTTPSDILWRAANFGELYWDWNLFVRAIRKEADGKSPHWNGVYVKDAATGDSFLPRIWEQLPPDASIDAVNAAEKGALEELSQWEAEQLQDYEGDLYSKTAFRKRIQEDCQMLRDMMADHPGGEAKTFGELTLGSDWNEAIRYVWKEENDGNCRRYIVATDNFCYKIYMDTS